MDYKHAIQQYLLDEIKTLQALDIDAIDAALHALMQAYERESTIFVFGNGGSASTASHFQSDFNNGISRHVAKKFHFVCLNDNVPTVMAIANDSGYEEIFRLQLKGRARTGDVVIAISGSGNSPNVVNAAEYAKEQGCTVIGLTGFSGGKLGKLCDIHLNAPVHSMQIAEDVHMMFDHLMMSVLCKELCGIEHMALNE